MKVKSQKALRDYFAAKALIPSWPGMSVNDVAHSADLAYTIADEMLKVRNAEPEESSEVISLREQVEVLQSMRPHWAKGYSSDSMAAQGQTAALSQIWSLLGVSDQTACMEKLRSLV